MTGIIHVILLILVIVFNFALGFSFNPNAGEDRRQEEKGTTEDEVVGWHH